MKKVIERSGIFSVPLKKIISLLLSAVMIFSIMSSMNIIAFASDYSYTDIKSISYVQARDIYQGFDSYEMGLAANVTFNDGYEFYYDFGYDYDHYSDLYDIQSNLMDYFANNVYFSIEAGEVSENGIAESTGTITVCVNAPEVDYEYNTSVDINVVENPVESIALAGDMVQIFYPTVDFEESKYYDIGRTDILITYKDGTSQLLSDLLENGYTGWANDGYSHSIFIPNAPSCMEPHGNPRHRVEYISNQAQTPLKKGETYPVIVKYMGQELTYYLEVFDSHIDHLEFEPLEPYEIIENTNGYFDEYEQCYFYWVPTQSGDKLIIYYDDSTTEVFTYVHEDGYWCFYDENGNVVDRERWDEYSNQYSDNLWTIGSDNYFTIQFYDKCVNVPVTIVENPVESISYTSVKPIEIIENTNGYYTEDEDGEFFYYYDSFRNIGDTLTIHYKNGTSSEYVLTEDEDYDCYVNSDGDRINYWDVDVDSSNQWENHWSSENDNCYYLVTYMGAEAKVPVKIFENPVEGISYTPVKPIEIVENTNGYWENDEDGEEFYYYYCPWGNYGDKLTVNYKDDTSKEYTYEYNNDGSRWDWINADGEVLDWNYFYCSDNQWTEHWTAGSDNYYTVEYMGAKTQVPVTIIANTAHTHSYTINVTAPTCTKQGYTTYTCECGESYVDNYLPAAGHTVVTDKAVAATCTTAGKTAGSHCSVCGTVITAQKSVAATGHSWNAGVVTKKATCTQAGVKTYTCSKCGATKTSSIAKTAHTYKTTTTKATTKKNGSIVTKCSVCGAKKSTTAIPYIKSVTLSATSYVYNGKVRKPSVTVKDSKGNKISSKYYTVTYSKGRKAVGTYTVKITFKGNYSGTVKKAFTIKPKATSISKLTAKSKGFTVKWKKLTTQTTGYKIQYSTSSKFTSKTTKTVTVSKNKTTSKTISKLKSKKKYYVRIRTYKTVNSKKIYSAWSKAKAVTTKK